MITAVAGSSCSFHGPQTSRSSSGGGSVEAVGVLVELERRVAERVGVVPHPPQHRGTGRVVHAWKLENCRAARTTAANCSLELAAPSTSIGAWSSRRLLTPNSQARVVFAS